MIDIVLKDKKSPAERIFLRMRIENVSIVGMGALGVMYGDFFTAKLG